ncbi:polysaccharide deacetylase family protein [Curvivirga aplysinae]|uniref:polysaccharide deacetylase family protein n=1 Tax=Curvivirga aplysinae TaxID=2529852 RepID=UPI0012BD5B8F|nr:polysaccharide deacetylase family protein [Curvivirga aplysinae]MTI09329.1 hypothetical protein [Curvivirga aplysinae]
MPTIKEEKQKLLSDTDFITNPWVYFTAELDNWAKEGAIAEFWWRDDDAVANTSALQKLMTATDHTPISLAVIPDQLEESLQPFTSQHKQITIVQHGFAHVNHAPTEEKKAEFRDHRSKEVMTEELKKGHSLLKEVFGGQFKPLFVPPWNRLGNDGEDAVKEAGLKFVSTFTPRQPNTGPDILNTHIDPVNWKANRQFLGDTESLLQAILHLRAKREVWENVDVIEPTGFLSHHLIHDEETWSFIEKFNHTIQQHPSANWLDLSTYIDSFSIEF